MNTVFAPKAQFAARDYVERGGSLQREMTAAEMTATGSYDVLAGKGVVIRYQDEPLPDPKNNQLFISSNNSGNLRTAAEGVPVLAIQAGSFEDDRASSWAVLRNPHTGRFSVVSETDEGVGKYEVTRIKNDGYTSQFGASVDPENRSRQRRQEIVPTVAGNEFSVAHDPTINALVIHSERSDGSGLRIVDLSRRPELAPHGHEIGHVTKGSGVVGVKSTVAMN